MTTKARSISGSKPSTFLAKVCYAVPAGIELGYHLCYGSPADEHMVQPKDAGIMVEMTNAIVTGLKGSIQFFHLPVPRGCTDDVYDAPLENRKLGRDTEPTSASFTITTPQATRLGSRPRADTRALMGRAQWRYGVRRSDTAACAARRPCGNGGDCRVGRAACFVRVIAPAGGMPTHTSQRGLNRKIVNAGSDPIAQTRNATTRGNS